MPVRSWDIFCTVIDNFGDIGVCWRLSRQLAQEHGHAVRLWIDDLDSFARLARGVDVNRDVQRVAGVEVRRWHAPNKETATTLEADGDIVPHDVVVEAFACDLPETFLQRMAARPRPPVWINLEYLSAESWVAEHHRMRSPHPRLPLTKHFFFPGFTRGTGGLLRETMLGALRDDFLAAPAAQARMWHRLGVTPQPDSLKISLFCYPNAALPALLDQWRDGDEPIQCFVPEGAAARQAAEWASQHGSEPGARRFAMGRLALHIVPFVPQEQFDELLWMCDLNMVRGEDSLVRAQWAAVPFIWHIYPQDNDVHRVKLDAFLELCRESLAAWWGEPGSAAARAMIAFSHAWNAGTPPDWPALRAVLPTLASAGIAWSRHLQAHGDLAANLVAFCENQVE